MNNSEIFKGKPNLFEPWREFLQGFDRGVQVAENYFNSKINEKAMEVFGKEFFYTGSQREDLEDNLNFRVEIGRQVIIDDAEQSFTGESRRYKEGVVEGFFSQLRYGNVILAREVIEKNIEDGRRLRQEIEAKRIGEKKEVDRVGDSRGEDSYCFYSQVAAFVSVLCGLSVLCFLERDI